MRSSIAALLLITCLSAPGLAQAEAWRWPVRGELVRPFAFVPGSYAAGQHRGIDLRAPRGSLVRAACSGRVSFAGEVGRSGGVVAQRCAELVATYAHLGAIRTQAGAHLSAGASVGEVAAGAAPHLHLGARRAGRAAAYVDPLALFGDSLGPPLGLAPPPGLARAPGRPPPSPRPLRAPRGERHARAVQPPLAAWAGLALALCAAAGIGALRRPRRRGAEEGPSEGVPCVVGHIDRQ